MALVYAHDPSTTKMQQTMAETSTVLRAIFRFSLASADFVIPTKTIAARVGPMVANNRIAILARSISVNQTDWWHEVQLLESTNHMGETRVPQDSKHDLVLRKT